MASIDSLHSVISSRPREGPFPPSLHPSDEDRSNPQGERAGGNPDSNAGESLAGLRILVVEDDADAREMVTAVLVDAGAVVESASSVPEGFDAVCRFRPDLLVSDIGMPDEDGYSLMRRVRALGTTEGGAVPSIALSAFTRVEDRLAALKAGFSLHVGKPVLPEDLVSAIRGLVAPTRDPRA